MASVDLSTGQITALMAGQATLQIVDAEGRNLGRSSFTVVAGAPTTTRAEPAPAVMTPPPPPPQKKEPVQYVSPRAYVAAVKDGSYPAPEHCF